MVNIRKSDTHPDASSKGVDVVVVVRPGNAYTNPKTGNTVNWLNVEAAQMGDANPHLPRQTQPSLFLEKDESGRRNTGVAYSESQLNAIMEVASQTKGHISVVKDKDGNDAGYAALVKADIMFPKTKEGKSLPPLINTKSMQPSAVVIPEGTDLSAAQYDAVKLNRDAKMAEKEAQAAMEAPSAPAAVSYVPPAVAAMMAEQQVAQEPVAAQMDNEPPF